MQQAYFNDQAYIAQGFHLEEDFTEQSARLAFFKINSFKLTLIKSGFRKPKDELKHSIRQSLFNYTCPAIILADRGFFRSEYEN